MLDWQIDLTLFQHVGRWALAQLSIIWGWQIGPWSFIVVWVTGYTWRVGLSMHLFLMERPGVQGTGFVGQETDKVAGVSEQIALRMPTWTTDELFITVSYIHPWCFLLSTSSDAAPTLAPSGRVSVPSADALAGEDAILRPPPWSAIGLPMLVRHGCHHPEYSVACA